MPAVIITGASRGIGLEFARQHLADGYQVYATCHSLSRAQQLKVLYSSGNGRLEILEMDVTNDAQVKGVAEQVKGTPIDLLINNAGTVESIFYGSGAYEGHDDADLSNSAFERLLYLPNSILLIPLPA